MRQHDMRGPVSGHSGTPDDDWTRDDLRALLAWGTPILDNARRLLDAHAAGLSDEQIRRLARARAQRDGEQGR